jgi:hypothetical protein
MPPLLLPASTSHRARGEKIGAEAKALLQSENARGDETALAHKRKKCTALAELHTYTHLVKGRVRHVYVRLQMNSSIAACEKEGSFAVNRVIIHVYSRTYT